jgi:hypothetical protein
LFSCSELRKAVEDETSAKEAVQVAFTAVQVEHADLEQTAVAMCQELEGKGASSSCSVASLLRSLGGRVAECIRSAFRLRVQRTLAMASTHYDMNLERVSSGYIVALGVEADAAMAAMKGHVGLGWLRRLGRFRPVSRFGFCYLLHLI